jgi:integrase/recombinase XerD
MEIKSDPPEGPDPLIEDLPDLPKMCKTNRSGKSTCLTEHQIEIFCSNLPIKYSLLAELMYFSAGRVKEVTTIRVRNLNFKDGTLTIEKSSTKTKESRMVPIHPRVMDGLQSWIKEHELKHDDHIFFTNSKNTEFRKGEKSISTQSVDQFFRKTFDYVGVIGGSTHSFRRSRLTHLLQRGWNLREIMDISGHKNLLSLQQYLDSDRKITHQKYREMFDQE